MVLMGPQAYGKEDLATALLSRSVCLSASLTGGCLPVVSQRMWEAGRRQSESMALNYVDDNEVGVWRGC